MDRSEYLQAGFSFGVVRLIRHQEQQEACYLQLAHRIEGAGRKLEIVHSQRRLAFSGRRVHDIAIDHAIAIEKDRSVSTRLACSHFVSFLLSRGCDTTRCQITAWKDSACAVTVSAERVGITTHASAICAV